MAKSTKNIEDSHVSVAAKGKVQEGGQLKIFKINPILKNKNSR